ncbi:putative receptor-like protein kinase At3g47110 [Magnolia sinica]|uniref:putative receptor-like protein kinase At3g47110 n=1 Tax=Magnolia sinica TaxID=86752 RepID=UPI00265AACF5|nr:putative receptor-like protein kinase At3g47110 [Magnolia sinica]
MNFGSLKGLFRLELRANELGIGKARDLSFLDSLTNCSSLQWVDVSRNCLSGALPNSIANLSTQLTFLSLGSNMIFGNIPSGIQNLIGLTLLGMEYNYLTGTIPIGVGKLNKLEELYFDSNGLSGKIPPSLGNITRLYDLYIPSNLGNCINLNLIYLFNNNFSGTLPNQLFSIPSLIELQAGNNFFTNLPHEASYLKALGTFNVSNNKLSGEIPSWLGNFLSLEYLVLDGNFFQGSIPSTFSTLKGLRYLDLSRNNLSGKIPRYLEKFSLEYLILSFNNFEGELLKQGVFGNDPFMNLSYAELYKATDEFSLANLIGTGSFGVVYKGILDHVGTMVAVKVFNLQQQGALQSFMAECKALRNIRHRNLVKILTCCSSIDFKGNDFKALVYEYMSNGSLENWLHGEGHDQSRRNLKFTQRLNIAIDVASALDYLHNHCQTSIIHQDLKPSNILLDEDMIAHVGDFGLARFLSEVAHSSSVGMKGSIGSIALEYAMGGKASTQGDVCSYGILLLEMITGKGPTDDVFKDNLSLHHFAKLALAERVMEIVNPQLLLEESEVIQGNENQINTRNRMHDCLISMVKIGVLCSAESPRKRMQMRDVVAEMHTIKDLYLGVMIQRDKQVRSQILDEGLSYLRHY